MRQQASMTASSSVTQTKMSRCPAKASVMVGGLFSDGFHAGVSPETLDRAEESSTPPEKADTTRQQAPMMAASSVTQTEMNRCLVKASVMVGGLFSNGFHVETSLATLDSANTSLFHTTRSVLVSVPPSELMGCLIKTSAEAKSLIFGGLCTNEPLFTLKAETEGDRALKGLELSNYVLSPPRVGIEE